MLFTQFANFNALHTITAGRLNLFQHFRTKNLGTTTKIIPLDTSKLSKKGVDTLDELIDAFNVDVEEACSFFNSQVSQEMPRELLYRGTQGAQRCVPTHFG